MKLIGVQGGRICSLKDSGNGMDEVKFIYAPCVKERPLKAVWIKVLQFSFFKMQE